MLFRYKVLFCCEEEEIFEIGLIFADSYTSATNKIEDTYRGNLISIEKLKQIADDNLVTFPYDKEDTIDMVEDNYIW